MKDWRRVNVSFTRAQSKLIIIGSRKTLGATSLLAEFLELMDERRWVLRLAEGAEKKHPTLEPPRISALVGGKQGGKRVADDSLICSEGGEGDGLALAVGTPSKKARTSPVRGGVLKGRPILQDVVNGEL